jgi:hypothetical protein
LSSDIDTALTEIKQLSISLRNLEGLSHYFQQHIPVIRDLIHSYQYQDLIKKHKNPLNRFGKKCFSQSDEDGITLEIIRRMGIKDGFYIEYGVGNGMENNTLILAALGWRGIWVGGEDIVVPTKTSKFSYVKDWIKLDNIVELTSTGLVHHNEINPGVPEFDVISLDLDGNDLYLVDELLGNNFCPKLFIVEYNAKFPPPIKFQIEYNDNHTWKGNDYFGASLSSYVDLFSKYGYTLVCCNAGSGGNAFFVRQDQMHLFADVPSDINDIYVEPRYVTIRSHGHAPSVEVVNSFFK